MIKVLAVDDEAPIRQWLYYCISRLPGFRCVAASSAQEGIELAQVEAPDIVLSDIEMPGMNGLQMLEHIRRRLPDIYAVILTSHEDFDYARAALKQGCAEYILKTEMTEDGLSAVLEKARAELEKQRTSEHARVSRERFLQALALRGNTADLPPEELARQDLPLRSVPILALDCRHTAGDVTPQLLTGGLTGVDSAVFFTLGADHLLMVANVTDSSRRNTARVSADCERLFADRPDVVCGISDCFGGPGQLAAAIANARYRCSLSFYEPQRGVFWRGTPPADTGAPDHFQLEYLRLLIDQDFLSACRRLRQFIQAARQERPARIGSFLDTVISALVSYLHFACDDPQQADRRAQEVRCALQQTADIDQVQRQVELVFAPLLETSAQTGGKTMQVRKAIEYLDRHYAERITLAELAEQAGFSAEHFSRVFRRETGVNYITYLNNLRMKHAVQLLEQTDCKVYEIAEKVGFSSLSYFSTAFKKKFGKNPYEYQVSHQRGRQEQG